MVPPTYDARGEYKTKCVERPTRSAHCNERDRLVYDAREGESGKHRKQAPPRRVFVVPSSLLFAAAVTLTPKVSATRANGAFSRLITITSGLRRTRRRIAIYFVTGSHGMCYGRISVGATSSPYSKEGPIYARSEPTVDGAGPQAEHKRSFCCEKPPWSCRGGGGKVQRVGVAGGKRGWRIFAKEVRPVSESVGTTKGSHWRRIARCEYNLGVARSHMLTKPLPRKRQPRCFVDAIVAVQFVNRAMVLHYCPFRRFELLMQKPTIHQINIRFSHRTGFGLGTPTAPRSRDTHSARNRKTSKSAPSGRGG